MALAAQLFLWQLLAYVAHRVAHRYPVLHWAHHHELDEGRYGGFSWTGFFLWFDNWQVSLDVFLIEWVPLIVACATFQYWWPLAGYYAFVVLVQEFTLHNRKFNAFPVLAAGKWHLQHHRDSACNYGLLTPVFDIAFRTHRRWQ